MEMSYYHAFERKKGLASSMKMSIEKKKKTLKLNFSSYMIK